MPNSAQIHLAAGCFWGSQAYFAQIEGIIATEVCYVNGKSAQTEYKQLYLSDHAEAVELSYDRNTIHLAEILDHFYRIIDPLSLNRQGADEGRQYRTGIYYQEPNSQKIASLSLQLLAKRLGANVAIELAELKNKVRAEEYHQQYLQNNPTGYCHIDLSLAKLPLHPLPQQVEFEASLSQLSELSYRVTQLQATEAPFSSPLNEEAEQGIYVDIVTGQALFSSADKYQSNCGWPSFTMPITTGALEYRNDTTLSRLRTEVLSAQSSHLGHVFDDGPEQKGGLRYCINGAALRFIPRAQMEDLGYGVYLPYV